MVTNSGPPALHNLSFPAGRTSADAASAVYFLRGRGHPASWRATAGGANQGGHTSRSGGRQVGPVACGRPVPQGLPADLRVASAELPDVGVEADLGDPPEERRHGLERPGHRRRVRDRPVQDLRHDVRGFRAGHLVRGQLNAMAGEAAGPLDDQGGKAPCRWPVGFQNLATGLDLGFYAARWYSLMRPPRTGRRWIRSWERSAGGWSGRGGWSWRLRWGRRPL